VLRAELWQGEESVFAAPSKRASQDLPR
jgi:hypothetical protein